MGARTDELVDQSGGGVGRRSIDPHPLADLQQRWRRVWYTTRHTTRHTRHARHMAHTTQCGGGEEARVVGREGVGEGAPWELRSGRGSGWTTSRRRSGIEMTRNGGVKSISTSPRPATSSVTLGDPPTSLVRSGHPCEHTTRPTRHDTRHDARPALGDEERRGRRKAVENAMHGGVP
jgi:hypothetical protein